MRLRDRMVDLTHLAMVAGKTNGWVTGKLSGIKKSEKDAYCLGGHQRGTFISYELALL